MALNERDFYRETPETKTASYSCPHCKRRGEYAVRWVRRAKKDRLPPGADERDRALFPKLRDYLVRLDDMLVCSTCRRRFEIPSHQSLVFLHDGAQAGDGAGPMDPDDDNRGNR
jgi:hypothetical protein